VLRSDDPHHSYLESRVAREFRLVGVVVEPGSQQRAELRRHGKWAAWAWRGYQSNRQRWTGRAGYRRRYFETTGRDGTRVSEDGTERLTVRDINSPGVGSFLERLKPDLVIVCGTGYIRRAVLASCPVSINVHGGYLPFYRGNHGVFFAFERSDFDHIGASLHLVSARLDTGSLIAVVRPDIFPHDNDEHLYCRAVESAIEVLCDVIKQLQSGEQVAVSEQPTEYSPSRHTAPSCGRDSRL
jgi:folate-dependent phosphoribosylglycinamide formyltransferase PurN